jgi:hypothetical protein
VAGILQEIRAAVTHVHLGKQRVHGDSWSFFFPDAAADFIQRMGLGHRRPVSSRYFLACSRISSSTGLTIWVGSVTVLAIFTRPSRPGSWSSLFSGLSFFIITYQLSSLGRSEKSLTLNHSEHTRSRGASFASSSSPRHQLLPHFSTSKIEKSPSDASPRITLDLPLSLNSDGIKLWTPPLTPKSSSSSCLQSCPTCRTAVRALSVLTGKKRGRAKVWVL